MSEKLDELLRQDYLVSEESEDDVLRNKLYLQVDSALKLQELVKKKNKEYKNYRVNWGLKSLNGEQQWGIVDLNNFVSELLQSLVKESQKAQEV